MNNTQPQSELLKNRYCVNTVRLTIKSIVTACVVIVLAVILNALLNDAVNISNNYGDNSEDRLIRKAYLDGNYGEVVTFFHRDDFDIDMEKNAEYYQISIAYPAYMDAKSYKALIDENIEMEGLDTKSEYQKAMDIFMKEYNNPYSDHNKEILEDFYEEIK